MYATSYLALIVYSNSVRAHGSLISGPDHGHCDVLSVHFLEAAFFCYFSRSPGCQLHWDFGSQNCWRETSSCSPGALTAGLMYSG